MSSDRTDQSPGESGGEGSIVEPVGSRRVPAGGIRGLGGLLILLLGGLVAGLISFGIGEATYGLFQWNDARDVIAAHRDELNRLGPYEQNAFITSKMKAARTAAESRRSELSFGSLGGMLGLTLGLVGGLLSAGGRPGIRGGLVGLLLGGGVGAVAAGVFVPQFYRFLEPGGGLAVPILAYGGILLPLGAIAGLAFGVGLGGGHDLPLSVLGAVTGAAVGVVVFVMANSLAFPFDQEPALVPADRLARLVIHISLAVSVALFVALALARARATPRFATP